MNRRRRFTPIDRAGVRVEARAEGDAKRWIRGHAAVFGEWATLYEGRTFVIREKVRAGTFRNALAEGQDVRALFNHRMDYVLGRNTAGTLLLSEDARGLYSEIDYPDTQLVRDLVVTPMERGDITGMSFAFLPRAGGYVETIYERDGVTYYDYELTDADLYDVSVVTNPAYEGTDVGLRAGCDDAAEAIRAYGLPFPAARAAAPDPGPGPGPEPAPATPAGPDPVRRAARARLLTLAEL